MRRIAVPLFGAVGLVAGAIGSLSESSFMPSNCEECGRHQFAALLTWALLTFVIFVVCGWFAGRKPIRSAGRILLIALATVSILSLIVYVMNLREERDGLAKRSVATAD
jgi:hypothetical protein